MQHAQGELPQPDDCNELERIKVPAQKSSRAFDIVEQLDTHNNQQEIEQKPPGVSDIPQEQWCIRDERQNKQHPHYERNDPKGEPDFSIGDALANRVSKCYRKQYLARPQSEAARIDDEKNVEARRRHSDQERETADIEFSDREDVS